MLRVKCPWCGEREQVEFSCHGEACIPRPENADALDDRAWGEYLFFKENAKGLTWERWQHAFGCRRWFVALRDNVNDTFLALPSRASLCQACRRAIFRRKAVPRSPCRARRKATVLPT